MAPRRPLLPSSPFSDCEPPWPGTAERERFAEAFRDLVGADPHQVIAGSVRATVTEANRVEIRWDSYAEVTTEQAQALFATLIPVTFEGGS